MTEILFHGPTEFGETSASFASPFYAKLKNAYIPQPTFPRTDARRIERMDKYVDWKRAKLRQRMWIHLWVAGAILLLTPLAMAVVSYAWKFGLYGVLG